MEKQYSKRTSLLPGQGTQPEKQGASVRRKTGLENTKASGQADGLALSKDPTECEIYIVEGNSAGGSAYKGERPQNAGGTSAQR